MGDCGLARANNGLFRYREGKLAQFTAVDGLPGNAIYQILEDGAGHLWLSGPNGVALLNRHELDAQAVSFPRHFALMFYSTADMAANTEIYGGTQSSGCIAPQGDVWFPSNLGPLHIPSMGRTALAPPPLFIQSVLADGRPVVADSEVTLRPGNGRLEFDFTPIQLRSQDGLRFRYMLEGFETHWSAPTAERTADYTNLPAGRYRFRVQTFDVSNPEAVERGVDRDRAAAVFLSHLVVYCGMRRAALRCWSLACTNTGCGRCGCGSKQYWRSAADWRARCTTP